MTGSKPLVSRGIPYVFGYALSGTNFQLYALHPEPTGEKDTSTSITSTPVGAQLDLGKVADRIRLLKYIINLVRILQALAKLVSKS